MKKIKVSLPVAVAFDYGLWAVAIAFAFWADWRAGVALLAFDAMRAFENLQEEAKQRSRFGAEAAAYQQGYDRGFARGREYEAKQPRGDASAEEARLLALLDRKSYEVEKLNSILDGCEAAFRGPAQMPRTADAVAEERAALAEKV